MMKKVKEVMMERGINLREDWLMRELAAMSKQIDLQKLSTMETTGYVFTKLLLCDLKSEQCLSAFTTGESSSTGQAKLFQVDKLWNVSDLPVRREDGSYTQPALGHVNKLLLTDGQTNVLAYDFNGLLKAYQSKFPILRGCKVLLQNTEMQQGAYILEAKTACFLGGCITDSLEEDVRPLTTLQSSSTAVSSSATAVTRQEESASHMWDGADAMEVDLRPFSPTQVAKPEPRLTYFSPLLKSHNHSNQGWIRCFAARLDHISISAVSRQWEVIVELHDGVGDSALARLHPNLAASKLGMPSPVTIIGVREVEVMQKFIGIFLVSVIAPAQQQQKHSKEVLEIIEEATDVAPFLQLIQQEIVLSP